MSDGLEKTLQLRLRVVGGKARTHRSGQSLAATRRDLAFDRDNLVFAHVQQVEDIRVGAEATVPDSDAPLVAQGGCHKPVMQTVDDETRQGQPRV